MSSFASGKHTEQKNRRALRCTGEEERNQTIRYRDSLELVRPLQSFPGALCFGVFFAGSPQRRKSTLIFAPSVLSFSPGFFFGYNVFGAAVSRISSYEDSLSLELDADPRLLPGRIPLESRCADARARPHPVSTSLCSLLCRLGLGFRSSLPVLRIGSPLLSASAESERQSHAKVNLQIRRVRIEFECLHR